MELHPDPAKVGHPLMPWICPTCSMCWWTDGSHRLYGIRPEGLADCCLEGWEGGALGAADNLGTILVQAVAGRAYQRGLLAEPTAAP